MKMNYIYSQGNVQAFVSCVYSCKHCDILTDSNAVDLKCVCRHVTFNTLDGTSMPPLQS